MKIKLEGMTMVQELTKEERESIKSSLTVPNSKYYSALRYSKWGEPKNIPKTLQFYQEDKNGNLIVPRYTDLPSEPERVTDYRIEHRVEYPKCNITLRELQKEAERAYLDDPEKGLIILNTGIGKSILGLHIAYMLRQKTLIIVHKTDLVKGWLKDAKTVFGDDIEVGVIQGKKFKIGEQITIATIQTLSRFFTPENESDITHMLCDEFGMVIVDEVHHVGSASYDCINQFKGYYRLGLTATLERNDNAKVLFNVMFGGVAFEKKIKKGDILPVTTFIRETPIKYEPYVRVLRYGNKKRYVYDGIKKKGEQYIPISKVPYKDRPVVNYNDTENAVVTDHRFMRQVYNDVLKEYSKGHKCLLVFTKKEHLEMYYSFLKARIKDANICLYYGDNKDRDILDQAEVADITLATYAIATEGTNVKSWQSLFLVASTNSAKNLEQIVGRVRRTKEGKKMAYVYDYKHSNVWGMCNHFYTRRRRYVELGCTLKGA